MKRKLALIAACVMFVVVLTGCECQHQWDAGDCTTAKTCVHCKETEGTPLGHSWLPATCTSPAVCSACYAFDGSPLGHDWIPAVNRSGIEGRVCARCEETEAATYEWTPLTDCEKYAASNEEAHFNDILVGDWDTRAGKLPDSIRFCVANKKSYKNTHYCIYHLNGNYDWLSGLISFCDKSEDYAEATFHIYLDNELAYESITISDLSNDASFTLDVAGVDMVRVVCSTTEKPSAYCVLSASVY